MTNSEEILKQGLAHQRAGRYREALRAYDTLLAGNPDHPDALNLSGIIAGRTGDSDTAVRLIKKALAQDPGNSGYLNSLGNALLAKGEPRAALEAYGKGLALVPDDPDLRYNTARAYNNLANTHRVQGRHEDALDYYRKALELTPADPQIHANRGAALLDIGRGSEAVAALRTALELDPGHVGAGRNLGNACLARGRVADALACYRSVLERDPADAATHSNLLCALNYDPGADPAHPAEQARAWWRKHGTGLRGHDRFSNPADPGRRLKIGYVSADFRQHSVSYFFKPLLTAHNRDAVEVFCYADVARPDRVTRALRDRSDHWRDINGVPDQDVARQIRADGIDILLDLAGHTAGNRLLVFARQPAPVQITWLGYPNTTGIPVMHYRLTDAVADPPGDADRHHSETLIRLPKGFLCYQPPEACPDITPAPGLASGQVTFGSFNNIAKVNPDVIRVWARVLRAVPGSRLLMKSKQFADPWVSARLREHFSRRGVSEDRLELLPFVLSPRDHLTVYNRVDVALDTFPYNGTTTTCEALWMGVPVVTLRGDRHAARVGSSLLTQAGHPELIADSDRVYVQKAAALAADLKGLDDLRQGLRPRMRASRLCDTAGFAMRLEQVYRKLWAGWCTRENEKMPAAAPEPASGMPDDPRQTYRSGLALLETGDFRRAEEAFERTIALDPGHADAHYNIGVIRQRDGRLEAAAAAYQTVVDLDPENADARYNYGNCRLSLGQPDQALIQYRQAVRLDPSLAPAHNNMGLALKQAGRLPEAVRSFQKAIELAPCSAGFHQSLGLAYHQQSRVWAAIACFRSALKLQPDTPVYRFNLAAALDDAGEHEQAARHLSRAVRTDPGFSEAYHNLADVLGKLGRFEESADNYRKAIQVKPDRPASWNGLGNALTNLGRTEEALASYTQAIRLHPDFAGAYTNLGIACYEERKLEQAEKYHRQALALDPGLVEAEFNLSLVHLLKGDLTKGWRGYEKRFAKNDWAANYPFRLDRPKWDGRPFQGQRLLVHDEQGLGDALQFARYLDLVKARGGTVLFETRKPLLTLFENTRGIDQLIERSGDGKPAVDFDLYCPLLSLPMLFTPTLAAIPNRVPYIKADAGKAARWAARIGAAAFKAGIVWSGNPTHFRGLKRSVALEDFAVLLQTPGIRFYSFQKGPAAGAAERCAAAGRLINLGDDFADFSDTAAALEQMDLLISIDTSVAHLAGAMGKPVWLLLAYAADWRWLLGRSDTPWYPTMRLFRQEKNGDWAGVMAAVQEALKDTLAKI